jgi:hypothetical protein
MNNLLCKIQIDGGHLMQDGWRIMRILYSKVETTAPVEGVDGLLWRYDNLRTLARMYFGDLEDPTREPISQYKNLLQATHFVEVLEAAIPGQPAVATLAQRVEQAKKDSAAAVLKEGELEAFRGRYKDHAIVLPNAPIWPVVRLEVNGIRQDYYQLLHGAGLPPEADPTARVRREAKDTPLGAKQLVETIFSALRVIETKSSVEITRQRLAKLKSMPVGGLSPQQGGPPPRKPPGTQPIVQD